MRPFQLWLLTVAVFAVAMVAAFFIGSWSRRARMHAGPQLDPELAVAIETSRRTLPQFVEKLRKPAADATAFAVKASFIDGGRAEMMWVDHLQYVGGAFDGSLADVPRVVKRLHKGDRVHILASDVVDWEVVYRKPTGEVIEGAETDRVLRRHQAGQTLRYPPRMPSSRPRLA